MPNGILVKNIGSIGNGAITITSSRATVVANYSYVKGDSVVIALKLTLTSSCPAWGSIADMSITCGSMLGAAMINGDIDTYAYIDADKLRVNKAIASGTTIVVYGIYKTQ